MAASRLEADLERITDDSLFGKIKLKTKQPKLLNPARTTLSKLKLSIAIERRAAL